jgi:hypothetical protein
MSVCTNLGPDPLSRLAAYAGCLMLRARLRAQRTHQCALAIADSHNFFPIVPMSVCTNLGPDLPSRLAEYAVCVVLCARVRALSAHQCTLAIADPHNFFPLSK